MKGLVQLNIEFNFNQIMSSEDFNALKLFTGEDSMEGIARYNMDNLIMAIIDNHLRKEHISYSVEGFVVPDEESTLTPENEVSTSDILEEYSMVDVAGESEPVEEIENVVDLENVVLSLIEGVSLGKGIPTVMEVTAELFDQLRNILSTDVADDEFVEEFSYRGLPVKRVDSEYLFALHYTSYETGDIETEYLNTLARTL